MARIINTADLQADNKGLDHNTREWVYNGLDTCVTLEIYQQLSTLLDNTTAITYDFSKALQAPILEMTQRGVLVDQNKRAEVLANYMRQREQLDAQLTEIALDGIGFTEAVNVKKGRETSFWWRSPAKLKNLFYDVMGLKKVMKRGAQGEYVPTVDRDALEKLQNDYFIAEPIVSHLLALRDVDKKRTFLETGIDPDGRIRTNFNIAGTNTGRLASSASDFGTGGNLQNVDRELRSVFVADRGRKFCNIDLEQGDARNVGAICWNLFVNEHGEEFAGSYLDACESGDLHTTNSRLIWPDLGWTGDLKLDKPIAEKIFYRQDSYRQMSKKGGHGTNYYGTPFTMAKHLKVPVGLIKDFQYQYFRAYPVIGDYAKNKSSVNWHNWVRQQLLDYGQLTTMLGRRRRFYGRAWDDQTLREAIAYEPQSLTADEIDRALLFLHRTGRIHLHIQVHDSILFSYLEEEENEIIPWALELAKTRIELRKGREFVVPTEDKVGWNWGEFDAVANPDGLIKWKGSDSRVREGTPWLKGFQV